MNSKLIYLVSLSRLNLLICSHHFCFSNILLCLWSTEQPAYIQQHAQLKHFTRFKPTIAISWPKNLHCNDPSVQKWMTRCFGFSKKTSLPLGVWKVLCHSLKSRFFLMLDVLNDSLIPVWQVAVVFVLRKRVEVMKKKLRGSIKMHDIMKMSLNKYSWIGSNFLFQARDEIWPWDAKNVEMSCWNDFEICSRLDPSIV